MSKNRGRILRINDFGLCEIETEEHRRVAFTLDKLADYAGQPLRDHGLEVGAAVIVESDRSGRVKSAQLA